MHASRCVNILTLPPLEAKVVVVHMLFLLVCCRSSTCATARLTSYPMEAEGSNVVHDVIQPESSALQTGRVSAQLPLFVQSVQSTRVRSTSALFSAKLDPYFV